MGFSASVASRVICVLAMLAFLHGCCGDVSLSLGRFSGFMSASFRLAGGIDIDAFSAITLSGGIGTWAGVSFVTDIDLDIDVTAVRFVTGDTKTDIDQDGADETVRLLVAIDDLDETNTRVFIAWKGDKYTLDEGQCYLAWLDGDTIRLASASCDDAEGAIVCQMRADDESTFDCEGCVRLGDCSKCPTDGKAKDCQPQFEVDSGTPLDDMDGGISADADIDGDVAVDAPVDGAISVDAPGDASAPVELSSCQRQVVELAGEVDICGIDVSLDEQTLCEQRSGDVGICYAAYKALDTLGQNTCTVLRDEYLCGTIMSPDDPAADCRRRLQQLVTQGTECGMTIELDADEVCAASPGEVEACYAPYDVARLAGQDVCAVLGEDLVCAVIN